MLEILYPLSAMEEETKLTFQVYDVKLKLDGEVGMQDNLPEMLALILPSKFLLSISTNLIKQFSKSVHFSALNAKKVLSKLDI